MMYMQHCTCMHSRHIILLTTIIKEQNRYDKDTYVTYHIYCFNINDILIHIIYIYMCINEQYIVYNLVQYWYMFYTFVYMIIIYIYICIYPSIQYNAWIHAFMYITCMYHIYYAYMDGYTHACIHVIHVYELTIWCDRVLHNVTSQSSWSMRRKNVWVYILLPPAR